MLWRNEDFSTGKTKLRQKKSTKYKRKKNYHQNRVYKVRRYVVNVVKASI